MESSSLANGSGQADLGAARTCGSGGPGLFSDSTFLSGKGSRVIGREAAWGRLMEALEERDVVSFLCLEPVSVEAGVTHG